MWVLGNEPGSSGRAAGNLSGFPYLFETWMDGCTYVHTFGDWGQTALSVHEGEISRGLVSNSGAGVFPPKAEAQFVYHHLLGESWAFGMKRTCLCSGGKNFSLYPSLLDSLFLFFLIRYHLWGLNELSGGSVIPTGIFTVCVHCHNSIS